MDKEVELLQAFTFFGSCENKLEDLARALHNADPTVALLTLEGLYRIEREVDSSQFWHRGDQRLKVVRKFLRKWRCESPLVGAYLGPFGKESDILRNLTIFKTLEVPLFIAGHFGKKELLSNYGGRIKDICIDGSTPIYHVTHRDVAQKIVDEQQLKPSDAKNIIKVCWFGLNDSPSIYGSRSFATTMSQLGVTGLHQGEIVSFEQEVNVVLYAADDTDFGGLVIPTDEALKAVHGPGAYATVSIVVSSRFLPSYDRFQEVFRGPYEVEHIPLCITEKRSGVRCEEL